MAKADKSKQALDKKYTAEVCAKIRNLFRDDVKAWSKIRHQGELDIQCITTETDDPSQVAGPWPDAEWLARHTKGQERPCLHEDVLTQFKDKVINEIEMNPLGIEAQPAGDGSDEKSAEYVEGRIRQWEYENNGSLAYLGAAREAATRSYGFWKNEVYYKAGFARRLCIEAIPDPDSCVPGPAKKPDWSDLRRFWELDRMPKEEYIEKYGKISKLNDLKAFDSYGAENYSQWIDDGSIQVARFWHFDVDERELLAIDLDDDEGSVAEIYADEADYNKDKVLNRRTVKQKKVCVTIFNGIEALEETEWIDPGDPEEGIDPEIPFYVVTGRVKYEKGEKTLESVIRKGRVGQLLYDYLISTIQEVIAMTPKAKAWGPEGVFDTSTDFRRISRDPTGYAEWKPVLGPDGALLPPPQWVTYEPPIQALEIAKQSILNGIQNAIGISTTQTKDRAAKSGKAWQAMQQDMDIATAHYFGATRIAQERQYRSASRILPVLDRDTTGEVPIRNKFGKHEMVSPDWRGRHAVTVGTGKLYQNLQDKQSEFASELLKVGGDPAIMLVALIGSAKMKGIGPYGDQLVKIFERILVQLHPQLADLFPDAQPEGQNPQQFQQQAAQAQQQLQALHSYSKQLEGQIIKLEDERQAEVLKLNHEASEGEKDRMNKLQIATINASTKENIEQLSAQVDAIQHISEFLTEKFGFAHEAQQNELDRQNEKDIAAQNAQAAQDQQAQAAAQEQQNQPQEQATQ